MTVELTHKDLVNLAKGCTPNYSLFEHPIVKQCGSYTGGMHDRWDWNTYSLSQLTEGQLWELYTVCCNSWKN